MNGRPDGVFHIQAVGSYYDTYLLLHFVAACDSNGMTEEAATSLYPLLMKEA